MEEIDFFTAFGRLLRDGLLRDAYANDPARTIQRLGVAREAEPALLVLNPEHLEFQAEVLLRKRFEAVSRLIPQTIAKASARGWPLFAQYAREVWPKSEPAELHDARAFCLRLDSLGDSPVSSGERNRLHFATGNAIVAIHFLWDGWGRNRRRPCLQVFLRRKSRAWSEFRVCTV